MMHSVITVIGGVNMDISATMCRDFVPADSIPGQVSMSSGGVARNIAHNLRLLGHDVQFISVFGDDMFGTLCHNECQETGLDLSLSERLASGRNGVYLSVNDKHGDMVAAVVDNSIVDHITPEFLAIRIDDINNSRVVVADTNLSTETLQYLIDHCSAPLVVDAVSTTKAPRILEALKQSQSHRLHTLKLNHHEALSVSHRETVEDAALSITAMGVQHVFITLGAKGVLCCHDNEFVHYDALPVEPVNTTGAGDAFVAGIAHGFVMGKSLQEQALCGLQAAHATLLTPQSVNPDIKNHL